MGGVSNSPDEMSKGWRWKFGVTGKQAIAETKSKDTDKEENVVRDLWNLPTFKDWKVPKDRNREVEGKNEQRQTVSNSLGNTAAGNELASLT